MDGYEIWISYLYFLPTMHVWFWTLPDGYAGHAAIKHLVAKIPLKRPDRRLWSGVESWTWQLLGSIHIPKASYGCHNTAKCAKTCYCKIWSFCRPGGREVYKKTFSEIFSAAATSDWELSPKSFAINNFPDMFLTCVQNLIDAADASVQVFELKCVVLPPKSTHSSHKGIKLLLTLKVFGLSIIVPADTNWWSTGTDQRCGRGSRVDQGRRENCQVNDRGGRRGLAWNLSHNAPIRFDPIQHHTWRPWPSWRSQSWSSLTVIVNHCHRRPWPWWWWWQQWIHFILEDERNER